MDMDYRYIFRSDFDKFLEKQTHFGHGIYSSNDSLLDCRKIVLPDDTNQHGALPSRHLHEGDQSHGRWTKRTSIQIE